MDLSHTLFVTDLDGTLLDDCSRVAPDTLALLNELTDAGARITVATARTPATVQPLLEGWRSTLPAITMTGAALWDRSSLSYHHVHYMPRDVASQILDICHSRGIFPFIYTLPDRPEPATEPSILQVYHHSPAPSPAEQRFIDERRHLQLKRFITRVPVDAAATVPPIILTFAIGPAENIFATADIIRLRVPQCSVSAYVDIFGRDTGILEIFAHGVSKAAAITDLASRLDAREVIVFGDNLNDIPMMRAATRSYAVAGALPEVKAIATGVIGSNLHSAVPRAIRALTLGLDPATSL